VGRGGGSPPLGRAEPVGGGRCGQPAQLRFPFGLPRPHSGSARPARPRRPPQSLFPLRARGSRGSPHPPEGLGRGGANGRHFNARSKRDHEIECPTRNGDQAPTWGRNRIWGKRENNETPDDIGAPVPREKRPDRANGPEGHRPRRAPSTFRGNPPRPESGPGNRMPAPPPPIGPPQ